MERRYHAIFVLQKFQSVLCTRNGSLNTHLLIRVWQLQYSWRFLSQVLTHTCTRYALWFDMMYIQILLEEMSQTRVRRKIATAIDSGWDFLRSNYTLSWMIALVQLPHLLQAPPHALVICTIPHIHPQTTATTTETCSPHSIGTSPPGIISSIRQLPLAALISYHIIN